MTLKLRRRRVNYLLPSESADIFRRMTGRTISGLRLGTRYTSAEEIIQRGEAREFADLAFKPLGGPFLLSIAGVGTIVFYDDDLLGSIVLREMSLDVEDPKFFDLLESQDRMGERVSIRHGIDLSGQCNVPGKQVTGVSVYKLPENFYNKPIGYDLLGECVVSLNIASFGELLWRVQFVVPFAGRRK